MTSKFISCLAEGIVDSSLYYHITYYISFCTNTFGGAGDKFGSRISLNFSLNLPL